MRLEIGGIQYPAAPSTAGTSAPRSGAVTSATRIDTTCCRPSGTGYDDRPIAVERPEPGGPQPGGVALIRALWGPGRRPPHCRRAVRAVRGRGERGREGRDRGSVVAPPAERVIYAARLPQHAQRRGEDAELPLPGRASRVAVTTRLRRRSDGPSRPGCRTSVPVSERPILANHRTQSHQSVSLLFTHSQSRRDVSIHVVKQDADGQKRRREEDDELRRTARRTRERGSDEPDERQFDPRHDDPR